MPSSRFEIESSHLLIRICWANFLRLKIHTYIRISRRRKHSYYERNTTPLLLKSIRNKDLIAQKNSNIMGNFSREPHLRFQAIRIA